MANRVMAKDANEAAKAARLALPARLGAEGPMAFEMSLHLHDVAVLRAGQAVVAGITADISPGSILLLRGANGSGKTSILRAVAGLAAFEGGITFKRGAAVLDAGFIRACETHYLAPEGALNPRLTAEETMRFEAGWEGRPAGEALAMLGLAGAAQLRVAELSTGQRRRLSLTRLLTAPKALWLLDEPFSGLDAEGREVVLALIEGQRSRGGVVLLALHEQLTISGARTLFVEPASEDLA